ncbi:glycosyltransferase [Sphingobacterium sp. UGAL515B_05]|jgi:glycosyltransferase involved in cell wall biosynthesis|uniref:glycosyltransferase n=1 Tax=Sphingobacterium sp. UGAL515B_05 TaxID=2986767 RepID=UPI002954E49B|nr:glycosyltransferase [Sphingobacterium sp. UGAL515B_05]WON96147.1 glycosyltransferase [Sphingobacterium sp. UGAL515B_05]
MSNRILILLPNDQLGGAEQHLMNVANYYLQRDFYVEVRFLTQEKTGAWRRLRGNLNLIFTNAKAEKNGIVKFFRNIISNNNKVYDFVYTSHVHLTSFAGLMIKFKFIKVENFIARESTSIFKRFSGRKLAFFRFLYKVGYSKVSLLICQTEFMKNQLISALPHLDEKINIVVIPNPINLASIYHGEIDSSLLDTNFIVSAGRLIPEKGFDILIKAFSILKNRGMNMKLVILGEGNLRDDLTQLAVDLGVFDDVKLLGFQSNVYPYFRKAKACVVSSIIEGFPNVLLQMMSQNEKVISTLCAGGIEDIPRISTCVVGDSSELAMNIENTLMNDTLGNREIFDSFLEERSITNFISKINIHLNA